MGPALSLVTEEVGVTLRNIAPGALGDVFWQGGNSFCEWLSRSDTTTFSI